MLFDTLQRAILLSLVLAFLSTISFARDYEFIDVHIHYNDNVWDAITPESAIQRLKKAGIKHAVVSSTNDDGTQKLYNADTDFVIRSLRPYKSSDHRVGWVDDVDVIPYLEQRLDTYDYAAIGEFHLQGAQADYPVVKKVVQLAKQHDLILHIHSDADAIKRVFTQYPEARIVWAHAGFEYASTVEEMMDEYKNLWADLSFRREIYTNDQFLRTWEKLLIKHADRFMIGVDTYIPQRWLKIDNVVAHFKDMLDALPEDVAHKIANQNAQRVYQQ